MNNSPFYITLPSDASMDQYPGNTAADWVTKLKHAVNLPGKWEVALVEMQYMNSLYTLPQKQRMIVRIINNVNSNGQFTTLDHEITIHPGHYHTADKFISVIEACIPPLADLNIDDTGILSEFNETTGDKAFKLEMFSSTDHRLRITLCSPRVHIFFPPDSVALQKILGFDHSDIYAKMITDRNDEHVKEIALMYASHIKSTFKAEPLVAPRPLNPLLGNQSLFVYCDVADYSLVGDSAAQVLRNVTIKGSFMQLITERFDIPHYVPVLTNHFETISISISTDLEDIARFATGKSLVKLHFRPLRHY